MQKLAANGMIEIQHGKPTRVRDIWREGNMNTLSTIIQTQSTRLGTEWVPQMLQVRTALAPHYISLAVEHHPDQVADFLTGLLSTLNEDPADFTRTDWNLHHTLTVFSDNPIYTLILNGFKEYYLLLAPYYFSLPVSRQASRDFYADLKQAAGQHSPSKAAGVTRSMMDRSIQLWQQAQDAAGSRSP